jgi:hypothetical protein
MDKICAYMKERASFEGVEWKLTPAWLQRHFALGTRTFFGVEVDDGGNLIADLQQPKFFAKYHSN